MKKWPAYIGTARMEKDGTIVLRLRSYDERVDGIAEAVLRYPRGHPNYADILAHLGGLAVGEEKRVRPWP